MHLKHSKMMCYDVLRSSKLILRPLEKFLEKMKFVDEIFTKIEKVSNYKTASRTQLQRQNIV